MDEQPQNSHEVNVATVAASGGSVPLVAADGGHLPPVSPIENQSRLTTKEVLGLFENSGIQRSLRSIERYCKEGRLVAFTDPDEGMYYIEQASAEQLISHLKEIQSRHAPVATVASVSPAVVEEEEKPEQKEGADPPASDGEAWRASERSAAKAKELDDELLSLKIDKAARDQVITGLRDQLRGDREAFTAELTSFAHRVGSLETRLLQLEGPKPEGMPVDRVDPIEVNSSQV